MMRHVSRALALLGHVAAVSVMAVVNVAITLWVIWRWWHNI